jgi:hypothetical protein
LPVKPANLQELPGKAAALKINNLQGVAGFREVYIENPCKPSNSKNDRRGENV